jgi:hypothetical protein
MDFGMFALSVNTGRPMEAGLHLERAAAFRVFKIHYIAGCDA